MPVHPGKVIISDTACLIGLTNIGRLNILKEMYETVMVTPEVAREYGEPLPEWIIIKAVSDSRKTAAFNMFIDLGESSAIALAMEIGNALLILDDRRARQFAYSLGLEITGTLGLLIRAYKNDVLRDLDSAVADLRNIGFRLPSNTEDFIKAIDH
jgi:predicted nucleic acid-binding protein